MSKFLSSGVYGCVYHPSYTCQGTSTHDKSQVTKIVKADFTTKTEKYIGTILKKDGFITVTKECPVEAKRIKESTMEKGCKLLEKDPSLQKKYVLLYSDYIKSKELAAYLKEHTSIKTIMKTYFLICERIYTMLDVGIIHHDLHFGNIMYNGSKLHVIDFGLSLITSKFYKGNQIDYKYLTNAIFKYSPSWNFWSLEYHFLCYLIHEGDLTLYSIEQTIDYYLRHHTIIKLLGSNFIKNYRETATYYFIKYVNQPKDKVVAELLNTSTTWDLFKIGLHFIDIYNDIELNIPSFLTLLLLLIHPIPEFRPTPLELRQMNIYLQSSYKDTTYVHKTFSKQLSKNLKKTITTTKAYEF